MTPNFTGLNCRSCRRAEVFLASTYYCCVGDKTSDSLIDGFADLTIPCESRVPEPGLPLWPAARGKLGLPELGTGRGRGNLPACELYPDTDLFAKQEHNGKGREAFSGNTRFPACAILASQPPAGYKRTGEMSQSTVFWTGKEKVAFEWKRSFSVDVRLDHIPRSAGAEVFAEHRHCIWWPVSLFYFRFINARRRIVQPMIDQSNRAGKFQLVSIFTSHRHQPSPTYMSGVSSPGK